MKNITSIKNIRTNKYDLEKEYLKALKNPTFKEIVDKLDIEDKELMKYTSRLEQAAKELDNYRKDSRCLLNEIPGFIYTPIVVNGILDFSFKACREKQEELEALEYLKNGYKFEVSKQILNAKMSDIYTNDKNRVPIIRWASKFIKEYREGKTFKGLYLSGNFGSGKSYIVSAIINELVKDGYKAALVYYPKFLTELKSSFRTDFDEQFEYVCNVDLLLLDDIGAESVTSWSRDEILCSILQHRMDNKLTTFFTSNLTIEELEEHLSQSKDSIDKVKARRIIERIKYLTDDLKLISVNNRN